MIGPDENVHKHLFYQSALLCLFPVCPFLQGRVINVIISPNESILACADYLTSVLISGMLSITVVVTVTNIPTIPGKGAATDGLGGTSV